MIYVASSWRNTYQPKVVEELRANGMEVYDFQNPQEGDQGFNWLWIDPGWREWDVETFIEVGLKHPLAQLGFLRDRQALDASTSTLLVLPCGKSAHLEAGYARGLLKPLAIYIPPTEPLEPELMYKFADLVTSSFGSVIRFLMEAEGKA